MDIARLTIAPLETDFSDDGRFSLDSQAMGYHAPSSAHSFSSDSSHFGPYTPTSADSTGYGPYTPTSSSRVASPLEPDMMDLSSSFATSVDSFAYDMTPPSSAASTYFQMVSKTEDPCGFFQSRLPATPSRAQADYSGLPYDFDSCRHTPPQSIPFYSFANELGPSPLPPTPVRSVKADDGWGAWPMWTQQESPISFGKQPTPLQVVTTVKRERSSPSIQTDDIGRRLFVETAKERTTALQNIQNQPTENVPKRPRLPKTRESMDQLADLNDLPMTKAKSSKHHCTWQGCPKKFGKREHLQRHIKRYACNRAFTLVV